MGKAWWEVIAALFGMLLALLSYVIIKLHYYLKKKKGEKI